MTTLEYMEKQYQKQCINYERGVVNNAPQKMLDDIKAKAGYYEEAINALKSVGQSSN